MAPEALADRLYAKKKRNGLGRPLPGPRRHDMLTQDRLRQRWPHVAQGCFAGCSVERIVAAAGLMMADLFEDAPAQMTAAGGRGRAPPPNPTTVQHDVVGCTIVSYAEAKRLPVRRS